MFVPEIKLKGIPVSCVVVMLVPDLQLLVSVESKYTEERLVSLCKDRLI